MGDEKTKEKRSWFGEKSEISWASSRAVRREAKKTYFYVISNPRIALQLEQQSWRVQEISLIRISALNFGRKPQNVTMASNRIIINENVKVLE